MLGLDHLLDSSSSEEDNEDEMDELFATNTFIKHLRKCFITIDDSGYCESVLLPDLRVLNRRTPESSVYGDLSTNESHKSDKLKAILSKRIETRAYDYVNINKIKNRNNLIVHTKQCQDIKLESKTHKPLPCFQEATDGVKEPIRFYAKTSPNKHDSRIISALSESLDKPSEECNPFFRYLKYEAHIQDPNQTKKLRIFLPMTDTVSPLKKTKKKKKKNSIQVSVYKTAKISDLIGLICCKYTLDRQVPALKYTDVDSYLLKIADDEGEIEEEFSSLDENNFVGKFGFTDLALVERTKSEHRNSRERIRAEAKKTQVIVHFTDDSPDHVFEFESPNVLLADIFSKLCEIKNSSVFCPNIRYRLEHADQPGILVNQENFLTSFKKYEFFFFRENSTRKSSSIRSENDSTPRDLLLDEINDVTKMTLRTSEFNVLYLSKWMKVQFKLGLSIDNIELEEIKIGSLSMGLRKVSNFYSIPMKNVVSCELLKSTSDGKSQIRIIIVEPDLNNAEVNHYRHLDFECESQIADAIKTKCSHLMSFINSPNVAHFDALHKSTSKWSRKLYKKINH